MQLRVNESNQGFLNDVKSFEALRMNLINARLEAMKDKELYKIPKSQNLPLSQKLTFTGKVLTQEEIVQIVDNIYKDLDSNKFMTHEQRTEMGQNLIFQWNQIVNKALRDNVVSKSILNDFNTNVKENIRSFVSGLKGIKTESTKEIKDLVESQMNKMLTELKKTEKQRQESMNVQDLNRLDEKIMKLNQSIVSVSTLGIPLSDSYLNAILNPTKSSLPPSQIPSPSTKLPKPAPKPAPTQAITEETIEGAPPAMSTAQEEKHEGEEFEVVSSDYLTNLERKVSEGQKVTPADFVIFSDLSNEEIQGLVSQINKGLITGPELKQTINIMSSRKKYEKLFGNTINVTAIRDALKKIGDKENEKNFDEISGSERTSIVNGIKNRLRDYGTLVGFVSGSSAKKTRDIANSIIKSINNYVSSQQQGQGKRRGGYFVNPPSNITEKYSRTYNEPETKEQSAKRMKKMSDALQERNFTKISF